MRTCVTRVSDNDVKYDTLSGIEYAEGRPTKTPVMMAKEVPAKSGHITWCTS